MPLNYSKWDALEISDDSDIEGHPNVDHKSLVRWKQRDIHEKRQMRNIRIAQLEADVDCNTILRNRLLEIVPKIRADGPPYFSNLVERLTTQPSPDKPPQSGPDGPSYDAMILTLLNQVWSKCKEEGVEADDPKLGDKLSSMVEEHVVGLKEEIDSKKEELKKENEEKTKKITSEDIHEGWDSKYQAPKPAPEPLVKPKEKKKKKTETVEFETINTPSPSVASASATSSSASPPSETTKPEAEDSDSDIETPELTPALLDFSKFEISSSEPAAVFKKSFEFIQAHPDVIVEGAVDALLLEAFSSQMKAFQTKGSQSKKHARYAFQCIHQGLLIQYCEKLGKDGVRMFFRKMITGDRVAIGVFEDDVQKTYKHVIERAKFHAANAEKEGGRETIQLVAAEGSGTTISFNLPDGAPPEDLRLSEEAAAEGMDIEEVRKALQLRWDFFSSFPPNFQAALKTENLDEVNKVLGDMDVAEAEDIVQKLQMGGMLMFSEPGVRDATKEDPDRF